MADGAGLPRWWYTRSQAFNQNNMMIVLATGYRDANNLTSSVGGMNFGFCLGDPKLANSI